MKRTSHKAEIEAGWAKYRAAQWEHIERLNEEEPWLQFGWIDNRFVFLMQDNSTEVER